MASTQTTQPPEGVEGSRWTLFSSHLRAHWPILLLALLLVTAGGFVVFVGGHDALFADELGTRTIGAGLAALGVVLFYCCAVAIVKTATNAGHASEADAIGMFGCLIVTAISGYLVATQILGRNFGSWATVQLAVFAAFFVASFAGALLLLLRQYRDEHMPSFKEFPVLGSAVSLGLIVGLLQFGYTNVYVPASAEPSLSITPAIGQVSVRSTPLGPRLLVTPRIDLANTSGGRVQAVGAAYFLYGTCLYGPSPKPAQQQAMKAMRGGASTTLQGQQARALVGFGRFLRQGQELDAGETVHQFAVAILKPRAFDMASIATYVVLARPSLHLAPLKAGTSQQGATPMPTPDRPCVGLDARYAYDFSNVPASLVYTSEIDDDSWLHRLARGRQYLQLTYSTFSGVQPVTIDVSRDRDRPPPKDYSEAMKHLYGVTYDVARAGVILPRPARQ